MEGRCPLLCAIVMLLASGSRSEGLWAEARVIRRKHTGECFNSFKIVIYWFLL